MLVIATDFVAIGTLVVAVIAVLTTVYLWLRSRQRKTISYRLTSSRVVSVRREASDRISILYDGEPVGDVQLVALSIRCAGNTPIAAKDFERPLSIKLGDSAEVLQIEVTSTSPPDLAPACSVTGSRLEIAPLLLNPNDAFEVTALVSELTEPKRLDGRVAGVSTFTKITPGGNQSGSIFARASTLLALATAAVAIAAGAFTIERQLHQELVIKRTPSRVRSSRSFDTSVHLANGTSLCGSVEVTTTVITINRPVAAGTDTYMLTPGEVKRIEPDRCNGE